MTGRARLSAVGALLLLTCMAGQPVPAGSGEPSRPLRVGTFNLFHGGPWSTWGDDANLDYRLTLTARELRALDVDVLGAQEASEGRGRGNVAERLADKLAHGHVFAPATSRIFMFRLADVLIRLMHGFREGPALLSRFPVVSSAVYDLPRCAGLLYARVLLEADLQTPHGLMRVYSTHSDPCQSRRIAEIILARRTELPSILLGDLNDTPASPAIAELHEAGFIDAFAVANPGAPGFTDWQRPGARTRTVTQRVDYVFIIPGTAATARVLESRVILDEPDVDEDGNFIWPSDHYGVFAALEIVPLSEAGTSGDTMTMRGGPPMSHPTPLVEH